MQGRGGLDGVRLHLLAHTHALRRGEHALDHLLVLLESLKRQRQLPAAAAAGAVARRQALQTLDACKPLVDGVSKLMLNLSLTYLDLDLTPPRLVPPLGHCRRLRLRLLTLPLGFRLGLDALLARALAPLGRRLGHLRRERRALALAPPGLPVQLGGSDACGGGLVEGLGSRFVLA